jgi:hypothetical protein
MCVPSTYIHTHAHILYSFIHPYSSSSSPLPPLPSSSPFLPLLPLLSPLPLIFLLFPLVILSLVIQNLNLGVSMEDGVSLAQDPRIVSCYCTYTTPFKPFKPFELVLKAFIYIVICVNVNVKRVPLI